MQTKIAIRSLLLLGIAGSLHGAFAQIGVGIHASFPGTPVYEQPICPADATLWTPDLLGLSVDDSGATNVASTWWKHRRSATSGPQLLGLGR